jgi:hypothetical protein
MWGAAIYCHFERLKGLNAVLGALSIIGRNNTVPKTLQLKASTSRASFAA